MVPPAGLEPVPDLCAWQRKQWWLGTGTRGVLAVMVINAWVGIGAPQGLAHVLFAAGAFILGLGIPFIWEVLARWGLERQAHPVLLCLLVDLLEHDPETTCD